MDITTELLANRRETGWVISAKAAGHSDDRIKAVLPTYRKQAAARTAKVAAIRDSLLESLK